MNTENSRILASLIGGTVSFKIGALCPQLSHMDETYVECQISDISAGHEGLVVTPRLPRISERPDDMHNRIRIESDPDNVGLIQGEVLRRKYFVFPAREVLLESLDGHVLIKLVRSASVHCFIASPYDRKLKQLLQFPEAIPA